MLDIECLFFSIDAMSEIVRDAIEQAEKLKQEVLLVQDDFVVNEVIIV